MTVNDILSDLGITLKSIDSDACIRAGGMVGGGPVGSPPGLPVKAWLWIPVATRSCSTCLSHHFGFFPRSRNLFCLRFELEMPCGLLASRWFVSREDVHCSFRTGIHMTKPVTYCFIVRRKSERCRSCLRSGAADAGCTDPIPLRSCSCGFNGWFVWWYS